MVFGSRTRPGLRRLGILVIMATGRTMCSGLSNSANGLYHNSANGLYHGHLGYDRSVRPTQRRNRGRRKRAEKWRIAALYCSLRSLAFPYVSLASRLVKPGLDQQHVGDACHCAHGWSQCAASVT